MLAFVVPAGDYEKEAALLTELESRGEIDHAVGLANTEAMDGYMLADKLTPRQFSELAGLDYEMAQVVYAAEQGDYGKLMGNIASYKVPLIDMFLFVCEQADAGIIQLDAEQMSMRSDAQTQMRSAKAQLQGSDYSRMLLYLTLPVSGDETYAFIDTVRTRAQSYYPDGNVYVAGDSTNEYDFQKSFARDNTVVSIVSILIVLVVLFTFLSAGMPVLLILVIQGGIWINFSIPAVLNQPLFFMSYLVVSSIQMGANIDYAIVIASRYQELKNTMSHRDAMIETLNFAFPTVITSGTILAVAGTLIGQMTSEAAIVGIGQSLGRGTIISMLFVLFVLPQILLLGGGLADKTSISMPTAARTHQSRERVFVVGLVTGEISGTVSGLARASVDGNVNLRVISGRIADGAAVSIPIFLGDFDGQGHKITGLCLTESCSEYGLFSRVESGASVRNLTVEGEAIPAGTQTDVGGIVGQMVADITLRFSNGGLDELQTELNALQSLINRTLDDAQSDDAQSASDSVTGGVTRIAACADAAQSSAAGPAIGLRAVCRRSRHACRVAALGGHCGGAHGHRRRDNARYPQKMRKSRQTRAINKPGRCAYGKAAGLYFSKRTSPFWMSLYASDLVLYQRSHRVGELVKRADAGKIAAIDRVRRGQIRVLTREHADDGDAAPRQAAYLDGSVLDGASFRIVDELAVLLHLRDVVRLRVREEDEQLVLTGRIVHPTAQRAQRQPVAVAAGGEIVEDFLVAVGFVVVAVARHDGVAADGAERRHAHGDMAPRERLGDHVPLRGHARLPFLLRGGAVEQDVDRQLTGVGLLHPREDLLVAQVDPAPDAPAVERTAGRADGLRLQIREHRIPDPRRETQDALTVSLRVRGVGVAVELHPRKRLLAPGVGEAADARIPGVLAAGEVQVAELVRVGAELVLEVRRLAGVEQRLAEVILHKLADRRLRLRKALVAQTALDRGRGPGVVAGHGVLAVAAAEAADGWLAAGDSAEEAAQKRRARPGYALPGRKVIVLSQKGQQALRQLLPAQIARKLQLVEHVPLPRHEVHLLAQHAAKVHLLEQNRQLLRRNGAAARDDLARVPPPQGRQRRTVRRLALIDRVFQPQPEQLFIDFLMIRIADGVKERVDCLSAIAPARRADDAVPVEVGAAVRVEDLQRRLKAVFPRGVPDDVARAAFFSVRNVHPSNTSPQPISSGKRA